MGITIKKVHGDEYVYFLAGNKQFFLGRRDDHDTIDPKNLQKALNTLDKTVDKQVKRYVDDTLIGASYLDSDTRTEYLAKRKAKLLSLLHKIR